jgi:hypothetical protein
LKGEDEIKKGQIAHLDGDNENFDEENLVFLCLEHHDEYDSSTRLSKGLREKEVKRWRDELYREMQYRFRTVKTRSAELALVRFIKLGKDDEYIGQFRLKNSGDVDIRSPMVALRIPEKARGRIPVCGSRFQMANLRIQETREDFFEDGGHVAIVRLLGAVNPVLMQGHSVSFEVLTFTLRDYPLGSQIAIEYRVDAEDMVPARGTISTSVPASLEELGP